MSFILDALKKLEREKGTRGAGVVMVGPVQWGGPDRQRQRRRLILATAGLIVLAAGALVWVAARPDPTGTPPGATTTPASPVEAPPAPAATAEPTAARPSVPSRGVPEAPRAITPAAPPPRALDLPGAALAASPESEADTRAPDEVQTGVEDEREGLIDPVPDTDRPEYRLTAISERDGRPIAILNDRLVQEGDSFNGLRIIRIGAAEIEIEVDGERKTIGF